MPEHTHSEDDTKVISSHCILCVWGCGIKAHVRDGKLVKVEGMKEHPLNRGRLCPRGDHLVDYVYAPDRLQYPMIKKDGQWQRISWEQALDTAAERLTRIKDEYGARALSLFCGSIGVENIELAAFTQRFKAAVGTPNFFSVESNCFRIRVVAHLMTLGRYTSEEVEKAKCILLWAHNPDSSAWMQAERIREAIDRGVQLVVIDPRRIPLAREGLHLQIRPGTDMALGLAMLNVIIGEGLYDKEFVEQWTVGFDELAEQVKQYSPEKVAEITWVPAEQIRQVARMFATTKPASIAPGTCALDQQTYGLQINRLLCILQAITGNLDVPGGWVMTPLIRISDLRLPVEEDPIGAAEYPLFYQLGGRKVPYGQAMLFPEVVLSEKPYPIKSMIVVGGNPAMSMPESEKVKKALEKLDFLVVINPFMTETAQLADMVLPACTFLEKLGLGYVYGIASGMPYVMLGNKVIEPVGESWPDWKFVTELARRMGLGEHFPWNTEEEIVSHLLKPSGISLDLLRANPAGLFYDTKRYDARATVGFRTPSGKVEIHSKTLEEAGFDPIPTYREPSQSPISTPELAREYPLILITGTRQLEYTHTQLRNVKPLRRRASEPLVEIHPSTAERCGIADGEMALVETKKGSIELKARVTEDIAPQVVSIPHGWAQANVNVLTDIDSRDPISGYPELKAILCRVKKATS